jgi:CubicO group peptidase (beta-lactamase class C family)
LLAQDITGQPFAELASTAVLQPTGMTHSTFAQPLPEALQKFAATGYRPDGRAVDGGHHVYPELSAAGLWSTPSDLARFMMAIGRSYRGHNGGLLRPRTARMMLTRVPGGSGLGFGLSGADSTFRYRHTGGNEGYRAYAVAFANSGRGVVIMTNSDAGDVLIRELLDAISREFGWPGMQVRGS